MRQMLSLHLLSQSQLLMQACCTFQVLLGHQHLIQEVIFNIVCDLIDIENKLVINSGERERERTK